MLSLPVHLGGLGISIPVKSASSEFSTSEKVTAPLVTDREPCYNVDYEKLKEIKAKIRSDKAQNQTSRLTDLKKDLSPSLKRALDLAEEKGASTWLTVLPIEEYGFARPFCPSAMRGTFLISQRLVLDVGSLLM